MKKCKKSLALILSMLMLMSVFQVGASAYFPYINNGVASDAISKDFQITSVNVTDLYGDAVTSLAAGEGALVSCKVKATSGSGSVQLIATAYNSAGKMVAVKRSEVVTLGKNAEDVGVYLTVNEAATSFKAFLWDGSANLIPLTKSADTASDEVNVLSVLLDGEEKAVDTYTYDVEIPASQLNCPDIQVITDNPAARVEVTSTKSFPLTKQWDTEAGSATVTATVTLNGVEKAKYTFNITQAVPEITNLTQYKWDGGGGSYGHITLTPTEPDTKNKFYVSLEQVKEADYSDSSLGYKQSTIVETKPAYEELPTVRTMLANDYLKSGLGASMCCNISPTFLNAALIQQTQTTSGMQPYCTESFSRKDEANTEATYDINEYKSFSFDINRSAMVYVYNPENTTYGNNHDGFIAKGFEYIKNEFVLNYYYAHSDSANRKVDEYNDWYVKHIPVTDGNVSVEIPVGAKGFFVLIKFDEGQTESIVSNASYTKTDSSTVQTTTEQLFEPIPEDEGMVFVDNATTANLDNYIYKVQPWSDVKYILTGISEEVSNGEVIKLPLNPADIQNLTFTLNESADVYFVISRNGATLGNWRTAALDWFENGWRMLDKGEAPVEGFLYRGGSGKGKMISYAEYEKHAVKKHFEVTDTPLTVSLNLGEFQKIDNFKANDTNSQNQRTMFVIVKKTDR